MRKQPNICFDDICLVPRYSEVLSRRNVELQTEH